ncbi:GNAT family N-acetyltransferase, partial [Candidatus Micrarchaeota archaeon]|nr:GNAT family N-acetyltransferase [Candidatus Micrarchaeota archaeon]
MELDKIFIGKGAFFWTWRDLPFMPYAWLEKKDLETLPRPFFLEEIDPKCRIGFESEGDEAATNIIKLPKSFERLNLKPDLRKDLRRIEKKNADTRIVFNEENALEKSRHWFLELWGEEKGDFERRLFLWKEKAYTLSLYCGEELLGVHIAMEEKGSIYYLGCWWNRKHKNRSVPTYLLKKDIERAIQNGKKYYDLEVGNENYKKNWGVIE